LQKRDVVERLTSDQGVAPKNCVIQRFHRERAVCQAGDVEEVRGSAEGQHQVVVWQRMAMFLVPMRQADSFMHEIDGFDIAMKERHKTQQLADRADDIGDIAIACRDFVEPRGEEGKLAAVFRMAGSGHGARTPVPSESRLPTHRATARSSAPQRQDSPIHHAPATPAA
jgi:hypothetical protein